MLELTTPKHRSLAGNITFIFYAFGEMLITLFAYFTRNWQNLLWANTIFIGISMLFLYFTVESPLYLYSKKEYIHLEQLLRRMAKSNNRKDVNWYPAFKQLLIRQVPQIINMKQLTFTEKMNQLVSQRTTIQRILITSLMAFRDTLLYYKISYGLAAMKISPYISMLIGAFLESAGYITATIFMSTRFGRKYTLILFTGVTCLCILIIPFVSEDNIVSTIILSQIGKFTTSVANSVTWIYIAELFPTSIRSSTNGFALAISRLGAIAAPSIDASIDSRYLPITFYSYAGLAFISILLTLPLPETKDEPLAKASDIANT